VSRVTDRPVGGNVREVDNTETTGQWSDVQVGPDLLRGIVAGDNEVLRADNREETELVLNGDRLVLTPLLKETVHEAGITLLNVIDQNGGLLFVAVPVLGLGLVVNASTSTEVVSVVACLTSTCRAVHPEVMVLKLAYQVLDLSCRARLSHNLPGLLQLGDTED